MITVLDKSKCSGCTACAAVCTHGAITMRADGLGFLYPEVDSAKCVSCGLCERVCAFRAPGARDEAYPKSFLMRHADPADVARSKSGAAFVLLSDAVLRDGGVVYGARLTDGGLVEHAAAFTPQARDAFRGSKYIQSDLRLVFPEIKELLRQGRKVLFSGTPCQVAGLKSYVGARLSVRLYLVDILCHGVASPAVWMDHLRHIERKKGKRIVRCLPRNPRLGWDRSIDTFVFEDGSRYDSDFFSGYVYHKWITQRPSCGGCPFTALDRVSDVTIGDAWGVGRVAPAMDADGLGCSLVLVNTAKGEGLMSEVACEAATIVAVDVREMMQPVLSRPTELHPAHRAFAADYEARGYGYVRCKYLDNRAVQFKAPVRKVLSRIKHLIFR